MLIDCIYLLCLIVLLSTSKKFANFGVEEPTTKFKPRPDDWDKYIMRDRPTGRTADFILVDWPNQGSNPCPSANRKAITRCKCNGRRPDL